MVRNWKLIAAAFLLVFLGLAATQSAHAQKYIVKDLGVFDGGPYSAANRINNLGRIVGSSQYYDFSEWAFKYDLLTDSIVQDLGLSGEGIAYGVNDKNQVVGNETDEFGFDQAFLFDPIDGEQLLGTLADFHTDFSGNPVADNASFASNLNYGGTVAGASILFGDGIETPAYASVAVFWRPPYDPLTDIHPLTNAFYAAGNSVAYDISGLGLLVGSADDSSQNQHAFWAYSTEGALTNGLPGLGGTNSTAFSVADDGGNYLIVGQADRTDSTTAPVLWTLNSSSLTSIVADLGSLASGMSGSAAGLVRDSNTVLRVVGYAYDSSGTQNATLWRDADGTLMNLNSRIVPGGDEANFGGTADNGYTTMLMAANSINKNGVIVGYGATVDGSIHAFALTPVPQFTFTVNLKTATPPQTLVGTVSVPGLGPTDTATVALSSNDPDHVKMPASVKVKGSVATRFSIRLLAGGDIDPLELFAAYDGDKIKQTVSLSALLNKVAISPDVLTSGQTATGTVTLGKPAPSSGALIYLDTAGDNPDAITLSSSTLFIPSGATSGTFTITANKTATVQDATVQAQYGSLTMYSNKVTVKPWLNSIQIIDPASATNPITSICSGIPVQVLIYLNGPSDGNVTLTRTSDYSAAFPIPDSVTIPAGAGYPTPYAISVLPGSVTSSTNVSVAFSNNRDGSALSTSITVGPLLKSLTLFPNKVAVGGTSTGTVKLNCPAPVGMTISLSADSSNVSYPASISVPTGATSVDFSVSTSASGLATFTATTGTSPAEYQTATLNVVPLLKSVTASNFVGYGQVASSLTQPAGTCTKVTVTTNVKAPAGGLTLNVTAPGLIAPATVTVPGGATSATFKVYANEVAANTPATITVSNSESVSTSLTILPWLKSLSPAAVTVKSPTTVNLTLTLNAPAPDPSLGYAPVTVDVSSSNTAVAVPPAPSTPYHFTFTAGSSTTTIPISVKRVPARRIATISVAGGVSLIRTLTSTITANR